MLTLYSERELMIGMNGVFAVYSTNGCFDCDLGVLKKCFSLANVELPWSTLGGGRQ